MNHIKNANVFDTFEEYLIYNPLFYASYLQLLSESESEKKLMDEKARLLALSSALEFPENVKVCYQLELDKQLLK